MSPRSNPIMVMAGGTGGHVFPALAVACCLKKRGESIVWMGTRSGIESRLVPEAGYPIEWMQIQGLRGKDMLTTALAPFKLVMACWQAMRILQRHRPRAVLGMGGFASGPGGLMAWLLRIPVIIHEQNAVIGLTNRLLSRIACISFFAFPQAARKIEHSVVVGNPVRKEILDIEAPDKRLRDRADSDAIRLLVIGGSLGARTLNQVVPQGLALLATECRTTVRHQCGPRHVEDCQHKYAEAGVAAEISDFIDDMPAAYAWADLVICRAGALTVAELAAAGVASILVPFPYAVDDHQFHNAAFLTDAGAAERVRDEDFTPDWLADRLRKFHSNRAVLIDMAHKARQLAYTDAAKQVANGIMREARR